MTPEPEQPYKFACCQAFRKARKVFERDNPSKTETLYKRLDEIRKAPKVHGKPLEHVGGGIWEDHFEKSFLILYMVNESQRKCVFIGLAHKDEYKLAAQKGRFAASEEGLLAPVVNSPPKKDNKSS